MCLKQSEAYCIAQESGNEWDKGIPYNKHLVLTIKKSSEFYATISLQMKIKLFLQRMD